MGDLGCVIWHMENPEMLNIYRRGAEDAEIKTGWFVWSVELVGWFSSRRLV